VTIVVELTDLVEAWDDSAPPIVIGHALTLDRRSVDRLGHALARDGHRVLVWELPGHGRAAEPPSAWSVEAIGAGLAAAITAAAIAPPVVIGVSMGGFAALESVGGAAQLDVAGLVLIGCAGTPPPPIDARRVAGIAAWAVTGCLDASTAAAMAAAEVGANTRDADELLHGWLANPDLGRRFLNGYLALFARSDPATAADSVRRRGLRCRVLRGEHDPWVGHTDAAVLAELLGADHAEISGAAHQPQHTHSDATRRALGSITGLG
jgi:pimeloyl-ACP methyl ester carboxylesterase